MPSKTKTEAQPERLSSQENGDATDEQLPPGFTELKIQYIPLDAIKPYWKNPRINEEAVEKVQASIAEFGCQQPLVLDVHLVIIAGHTRYKALKRLGWKEVPVVIAESLTDEQAKAYRIADNATRDWSTWDEALLSEELRGLSSDTRMSDLMKSVLTLDVDKLLGDSVGKAATEAPPTQEEIDDTKEEIEDSVKGGGAEGQNETMREVRCPHCSEAFLIDIK